MGRWVGKGALQCSGWIASQPSQLEAPKCQPLEILSLVLCFCNLLTQRIQSGCTSSGIKMQEGVNDLFLSSTPTWLFASVPTSSHYCQVSPDCETCFSAWLVRLIPVGGKGPWVSDFQAHVLPQVFTDTWSLQFLNLPKFCWEFLLHSALCLWFQILCISVTTSVPAFLCQQQKRIGIS